MVTQMKIEVAYATIEKQLIIQIDIPTSTTILEAIKISEISKKFSELSVLENIQQVGIFGKKVDILNYQLQNLDRIEIYRPLAKTPNQRRLERALL